MVTEKGFERERVVLSKSIKLFMKPSDDKMCSQSWKW